MAGLRVSEVAGNRFSVRAKGKDQIKRVEGLSNHLGPLGDLLVSTWGGIFGGVAVLGLGGFIVGNMITANSLATLSSNIVPILFTIIGFLILALNVVLTNPSRGAQIVVSYNYLVTKWFELGTPKVNRFTPFKFEPNNLSEDVVLQKNGKITNFITVYSVRGAISPVSFQDELEFLGELDRQRLDNMENSFNIHVIVNMVQDAKVTPIPLPKNATPAMMKKRDYLYKVVDGLHNNQQLRTILILTSRSKHDLKIQIERVEKVLDSGLVIGYQRLKGKALKKEFRKIYG
jgi:hypothetical protein